MERFIIETLGCKVNSYESQAFREIFLSSGYLEDKIDPSIILINTCAVTLIAENKCRTKIRHFVREFPQSMIIVVGCYSELHYDIVKNIPGVSIVLGSSQKDQIIDLITKYQKSKEQIIVPNRKLRLMTTYENLKISKYEETARAFVKIQDGCNNFCSYCAIPMTRGSSRSRNKEEIFREINQLAANGYQEIVITGIDLGSYGVDKNDGYVFVDLMKDIIALDNAILRIRISSIEESQITDELISLMQGNSKIVPHLHIPLQSGSPSVLIRMKRKYNLAEYLQTMKKLQAAIPFLGLSTDVIAGFPGESEEEYIETYDFIKEVGFTRLHVFPYSMRPFTAAAAFKNQVPDEVKTLRVRKLIDLGKILEESFYQANTGRTLQVLFEKSIKTEKGYDNHGYSENYIFVKNSCDDKLENKIINIILP